MEEGFALEVKKCFITSRIFTITLDYHVNNRERIFQAESSKCTQDQRWEKGGELQPRECKWSVGFSKESGR